MLEDRKGVLIEHEGVPRGIENTGGKSFMDRNRHDQWHMAQQVAPLSALIYINHPARITLPPYLPHILINIKGRYSTARSRNKGSTRYRAAPP